MKAKVILYNPKTPSYTLPLGLMAIASYLDQNKYDVEIVDGRISPSQADTSKAAKASDNLLCIGVTVWTGEPIRGALNFSREAKRIRPNIPVVWGGWHPSILPEQCLNDSSVDIIVKGQGEVTFSELLKCLEEKKPLYNCAGIAFKENGKIINNPDRPFIDISKFPPLNYSFIDPEKYFAKKGKRQLDYYSSQGCPYRCRFCADPMVFEGRWSSHSATRVVQEIACLIPRYNVEEVFFSDDNLFANIKRIEEICDGLISSNLKISWLGTVRADLLKRVSDDSLRKIKASGCRKFNIGAESGSEEILKRINKKCTPEDLVLSAEKCSKYRIHAAFSFIVGLPHEEKRHLHHTINLIKKIKEINGNFEFKLFFYLPYPGSEISKELKEQGAVLPETLEEWIDFHFQKLNMPWIDNSLNKLTDSLNFYLDYGYRKPKRTIEKLLLPVHMAAKLRCKYDFYSFPLELYLVNGLKTLHNMFARNGGFAGKLIRQFSQY